MCICILTSLIYLFILNILHISQCFCCVLLEGGKKCFKKKKYYNKLSYDVNVYTVIDSTFMQHKHVFYVRTNQCIHMVGRRLFHTYIYSFDTNKKYIRNK